MEQNNFVAKYVNIKNLFRVLTGLWVLCFFLPFVKVYTFGYTMAFSALNMTTGTQMFGESVDGSAFNLIFVILPIVALLMWILIDVAQLSEKIASIVTIVCAGLGLLIQIAYASYLGVELGSTGYVDVSLRSGFWIATLMEICTILLSVFLLLGKLNANVVINGYNWKVFVNSFKSQQPNMQGQPAQQNVSGQPVNQPMQGQPAQQNVSGQPVNQPMQGQSVQQQPVQQNVQQSEVTEAQPAFCPNCGQQIAVGQKFCTGCGTKLN